MGALAHRQRSNDLLTGTKGARLELRSGCNPPTKFEPGPFFAIMNDSSQTGSALRTLFKANAVAPRVIVNATDTNVVMAYVGGGVGIAVVQHLIYSHEKNRNIGAVDVTYLFPSSATKISLRKDSYLRSYMYEFITMIAPHLERSEIDKARNRR